MLKEGDTAAKRDAMRSFLAQHGYRIGHVTIDNSDWAIDQRLTARLKKDPHADVKPYRDFYLEHMWARAEYYDSLARRVLGRPVKHTLLVHFNLLNGLFLDDLIAMFKSKGWQPIDAEEAFTRSGLLGQAESCFRRARASLVTREREGTIREIAALSGRRRRVRKRADE